MLEKRIGGEKVDVRSQKKKCDEVKFVGKNKRRITGGKSFAIVHS